MSLSEVWTEQCWGAKKEAQEEVKRFEATVDAAQRIQTLLIEHRSETIERERQDVMRDSAVRLLLVFHTRTDRFTQDTHTHVGLIALVRTSTDSFSFFSRRDQQQD